MGRGEIHGDNPQFRNDIAIDSSVRVISRAHCTFRRDERRNWWVFDDRSMNGLYYQGQRVSSHRLSDGDKITVGENLGERILILFSAREDRQRSSEPTAGVRSFSLRNTDRCVIGRSQDCDIVIDHPTVSRKHCIITRENGQYYVADNNSTNGVILNSHSLQKKTLLQPMDRISIAGVTFVFSDECLYSYEIRGGVSLRAEQLYKEVGKKDRKKAILNNVTLTVEPNQFVAIIGGSGAGKTTLLSCLSGMTDFTSGEVMVNGESIRTAGKSLQSLMGYVPQQDIVYDSLTLEHMLLYSAKLRMPPDASEQEIHDKIDETLDLVELSAHKNTLIRMLSGGERKRASIAVELLASPKLFFLDEPSSGLDPGTEKHLMQMLRNLAATGKTVIMITHTVQNLDLCDRVICMGRGGRLCFSGAPDEALRFFRKNSLTDVYDDLNNHSEETARRFQQYSRNPAPVGDMPLEKQEKKDRKAKTLLRDFRVMTRRYFELLLSNRPRMLLLLFMPIFLALLVCITFQADGGLYNFLLRHGLAFQRDTFPFLVTKDTTSLLSTFSYAAFWTGIFNSVQEISKERNIYERERFAGAGVTPYVLSKFFPMLLLCMVQAVLMTGILVFMTNTTATVGGYVTEDVAVALKMPSDGQVLGSGLMWLETYITTLLCVLSAMCLGLVISSLASNEMALVLCPICLMPQILFSGVVGSLSGFTEALSKIITCKWACLAYFVSANVNDLYKACSYSNGSGFEISSDTGFISATYDVGTTHFFGLKGVQSCWLVLGIMCLVCLIASILILRFRRRQFR